MSDAIEIQYFKDFQKKDYDAAVHTLWELHCQNSEEYPWPPTLRQIKKEIARREETAP